jgi:hypothetical protein
MQKYNAQDFYLSKTDYLRNKECRFQNGRTMLRESSQRTIRLMNRSILWDYSLSSIKEWVSSQSRAKSTANQPSIMPSHFTGSSAPRSTTSSLTHQRERPFTTRIQWSRPKQELMANNSMMYLTIPPVKSASKMKNKTIIKSYNRVF